MIDRGLMDVEGPGGGAISEFCTLRECQEISMSTSGQKLVIRARHS